MALDELMNSTDIIVENDGAKIVYDTAMAGYVKNATVDYVTSWYEKGFVLRGMGVGSC